MEEVEKISVSEEIAPPETEAARSEPHETNQNPPKDLIRDEDSQERNWKEMRRRQNDLEKRLREKDELLEKFMLSQMTSKEAKEIIKDELDEIGDDEYISKGKVNKLVRREAQRIAEEISKKETEKAFKSQRDAQFLNNLKSQYSDFDEIVNSETLSLLEQQDPELANTIAELKDPYKIGLQSYKYIKAMNLSTKVPDSRRVKEVEKKLEQNSKTIQSPQAYDKRPMAQAFQMTNAEKNKLFEEMNGFARMADSVPELR